MVWIVQGEQQLGQGLLQKVLLSWTPLSRSKPSKGEVEGATEGEGI